MKYVPAFEHFKLLDEDIYQFCSLKCRCLSAEVSDFNFKFTWFINIILIFLLIIFFLQIYF